MGVLEILEGFNSKSPNPNGVPLSETFGNFLP
jgi:hypothetical protein